MGLGVVASDDKAAVFDRPCAQQGMPLVGLVRAAYKCCGDEQEIGALQGGQARQFGIAQFIADDQPQRAKRGADWGEARGTWAEVVGFPVRKGVVELALPVDRYQLSGIREHDRGIIRPRVSGRLLDDAAGDPQPVGAGQRAQAGHERPVQRLAAGEGHAIRQPVHGIGHGIFGQHEQVGPPLGRRREMRGGLEVVCGIGGRIHLGDRNACVHKNPS